MIDFSHFLEFWYLGMFANAAGVLLFVVCTHFKFTNMSLNEIGTCTEFMKRRNDYINANVPRSIQFINYCSILFPFYTLISACVYAYCLTARGHKGVIKGIIIIEQISLVPLVQYYIKMDK